MQADLVVSAGRARYRGRSLVCAIGRGGIGEKSGEGDGITPVGTFAVERWLYRADRLTLDRGTAIGPRDLWCDDPTDPAYNTACHVPRRGSHERLRRADGLYDLVGVLDYNRALIVPGRGSAIFLHVWRGPRRQTEGCIAFRRLDLLWIARTWTSRSRVRVQS
ncbi:MAG: L,D-transpeptidase family protein [Pseudomonadota bacterium]